MAGKEYYEGRLMEANTVLHSNLISCLNLDSIEVQGGNTTKGDLVGTNNGEKFPISVKYGSQKNTQVHLPTLKSFALEMNMPDEIQHLMYKWLGVTSTTEFDSWLNGLPPTKSQKKYKRLFATDIPEWHKVVNWFNENKTKLAKLLIQSMNDEHPAKYLVWINKKTNQFQVIDTDILIDWISKECTWVTGPRNNGSTLRCEYDEKPIFHLQMKGSGGTDGEYNHNPQFHIHTNWPKNSILHEGILTA